MTTLDLSNHSLTEFNPNNYGNLDLVRSLYLFGNQLRSLEVGIFDELTNLEILDLSDNQLISLEIGIFDKLTNLKNLYLSRNQLISLEVGIFDKLTNLKNLYLSRNQLISLEVGIFGELKDLEILDLSNNRLTLLEFGVFDKLVSLKKLVVNDNRLILLSLYNLLPLKSKMGNSREDMFKPYYDWINQLKDIIFNKSLNFENRLWFEHFCKIGSKISKNDMLIELNQRGLYDSSLEILSRRQICTFLAVHFEEISKEYFNNSNNCINDLDLSSNDFHLGNVLILKESDNIYYCFSRNDLKHITSNPYTRKEFTKEQKELIHNFLDNKIIEQYSTKSKISIQKPIDILIDMLYDITGNSYISPGHFNDKSIDQLINIFSNELSQRELHSLETNKNHNQLYNILIQKLQQDRTFAQVILEEMNFI